METFLQYLYAFLIGGALCLIGQVLIDYTKLTPARILVGYVTTGVLLTAIGLYEPLVNFAGAGATVPLTGFGYTLAKGVQEGIKEYGLMGAIGGGITATAAGISAAIVFGFIAALFSRPRAK
ncbi:MAG: stage V sporulation protein AE [Clostridia bacterium]|nr:stage V sporulation protein AE [Clostridia bacterium]